MMKAHLPAALSAALILSACGAGAPTTAPAAYPPGNVLTVFAAASLTGAFGDIGKRFESAHPGIKVQFNFAGSQALRTQIEQGAAADIFASANAAEMDTLVAGKLVVSESVKIFLTNQLVVVMPAKNPAGLATLADLAGPRLKVVLAAKEVPVGNYAAQSLGKLDASLGAGFRDRVLANVVSYENDVKQVVVKVQLGEADAGIVYASDAVAAPDLKKIEIPVDSNVLARYPLAPLTQSKNPELARSFVASVLSAEGQAILQRWGFSPIR
ncbi:MAG TPA: molybdate ABC transporter substrate-binding protein [Thermoflexales bacterium]|jgi:molybdate transport system substrate-binding protein|nr:molybdate ABC transporter substrate-binding protein [Thermoflexales bacterium]HQX09753.1 molybdate ABC transporter substrate-binding protein [Thermoflexales bacterium]HQY24279.1 molybdate ABC transporter substrate-binding protein [Thermoflexales bacterium]